MEPLSHSISVAIPISLKLSSHTTCAISTDLIHAITWVTTIAVELGGLILGTEQIYQEELLKEDMEIHSMPTVTSTATSDINAS